MMIFLLSSNSGIRLSTRSFLLLLGVHKSLRSNDNLIAGKVIANIAFLLVSCYVFLRWKSFSSSLSSRLRLFHFISCFPVDEDAILISLLTLPLVRATFDLLDLFVFEAFLQALLPQLVPNGIVLILGEAIVSEFLRVAIVPMEHILDTRGFIVLPKTLLATILRLELRVVLLDEIELNHSLVGFKMRQIVCRFGQVMQMLGLGHRAIMRDILHRLRLGLRGGALLHT